MQDARGNLSAYLYDDAGRSTVTIDALGNRTTSVLDPAGNATVTIDPLGNAPPISLTRSTAAPSRLSSRTRRPCAGAWPGR